MEHTLSLNHINFGFRGEGIEYCLEGRVYYIDSTWISGREIHFDDLSFLDLSNIQKALMLEEIIEFVNLKENETPVIFYNSEIRDIEFLRKLCIEYRSEAGESDTINMEKANSSLYKLMSESILFNEAQFKIAGLKIGSLKVLDKHWDKIKQTKNDEPLKFSVLDKFLSYFDF